jgi:hypothetical protein
MSACHADDSDSNSDLGVALFPKPSLRSGFGDKTGFETRAVTPQDIHAWVTKRCGETTTVRTHYWVKKIGNLIGDSLGGVISFKSLETLRKAILKNYKSQESLSKCFIASRNFLLFLERIYFDPAVGSHVDNWQNVAIPPTVVETINYLLCN